MKHLIVFNWELGNPYNHRNQWKSELFYKGKTGMNISGRDRKSTRLNSSHSGESRMPSSA